MLKKMTVECYEKTSTVYCLSGVIESMVIVKKPLPQLSSFRAIVNCVVSITCLIYIILLLYYF